MTIRKPVSVQLPTVPNFISDRDVSDYTVPELQQIGKAWTDALIENAKHRRAYRSVDSADIELTQSQKKAMRGHFFTSPSGHGR